MAFLIILSLLILTFLWGCYSLSKFGIILFEFTRKLFLTILFCQNLCFCLLNILFSWVILNHFSLNFDLIFCFFCFEYNYFPYFFLEFISIFSFDWVFVLWIQRLNYFFYSLNAFLLNFYRLFINLQFLQFDYRKPKIFHDFNTDTYELKT